MKGGEREENLHDVFTETDPEFRPVSVMLHLIVVWSSVTAVGRDYASTATPIGNSHKKSFGTLQCDCTAGTTWHNIRPEKTERLLAVKFSVPSLNQKVTYLAYGKKVKPAQMIAWISNTSLAERKRRDVLAELAASTGVQTAWNG